MASVPWRCGHSCTWSAAAASSGSRRCRRQHAPGVERVDRPSRGGQRLGHHGARLAEVRRARDVGEHAAGFDARAAPTQQRAAAARPAAARRAGCLRQRASGRRRRAPSPVHGASSRIRSNGRGATSPRSVPSTAHDLRRDRIDGQRPAHQFGAVPGHLVGDERCAAGSGLRGEQRRLAARAGAQVEPALARRRPAGHGSGQRGQLGALVLHPCPSLADRGQFGRVAPVDTAPTGENRRAYAATSSTLASPGRATSADPGRNVVRLQQLLELVLSPLRGQRLTERARRSSRGCEYSSDRRSSSLVAARARAASPRRRSW